MKEAEVAPTNVIDFWLTGLDYSAKMDCSLARVFPKINPSVPLDGKLCDTTLRFLPTGRYEFEIDGKVEEANIFYHLSLGIAEANFVRNSKTGADVPFIKDFTFEKKTHPRSVSAIINFYEGWPKFVAAPYVQMEKLDDSVYAGLKRSGVSTSNSPATLLAMDEVLLAMESMRAKKHLWVPSGFSDNGLAVDAGNKELAVPLSLMETCLSLNIAKTWSDLQLHFYCQLPFNARSCFSSLITGQAREDIPNSPKSSRVSPLVAYDVCASEPAFKWVHDNFEKAFKHVMFNPGSTFAIEDQERVINLYYRVEAPGDTKECLKKRPRRYIDPFDGTHCLANKKMAEHPNGFHRILAP